MRTKRLLLMAAALAAGLTASQIQAQVYSVNTVGYINVYMTNGYNMFTPALDFDGTGTNNNAGNVFGTNLPTGASCYMFTNGVYVNALYIGSGKWSGNSNALVWALQPGRGVFMKWPTAGAGTNFTFTGTVMQGSALSNNIVTGYQLSSSQVPQGGGIQTALGFASALGDVVYLWNNSNQLYAAGRIHTSATLTNWSGGEPSLLTGQTVFLKAVAGAKWVRNFTVQ